MPCLQGQITLNYTLASQKILATQNDSAEAAQFDIFNLKRLLREEITLENGRLIHSYIAAQGWEQDTHLSNHIISMYGKCWAMADAQSVFDKMHDRDVVSWNSMIAVYAQHGHGHEAIQLFKDMEHKGMEPDMVTFIGTLRTCTDPEALCQGEWIHACILNCGFEADSVVSTALLNMYGKCGALEPAHIVFHKLHPCDTIPWNAMIAAYLQQGCDRQALDYFYEMQRHGIKPDKVTFVSVVTACTSLHALDEGKIIHSQIGEYGLESDVIIGNTLINMYGKCMVTEKSRFVFDRMQHRDLASWNAMLGAYAQVLDGTSAMHLFEHMQQENVRPDKITYVSLLCACENLASIGKIDHIHACIVNDGFELDIVVGTELLNTYGKSGAFESAMFLFNRMPQHNLVSWNAMISVHAQQGHSKKALELVHLSQQKCIEPDEVTFICALTACRSVAALEEGRILHACILDVGCTFDVVVGNALVSMYGKCEALEDAHLLFNKMPWHNVITWNALMDAHVQLGRANEVLQILRQMQEEGFKPDEGTYVSVLSGCASLAALSEGQFVHMCIVDDGLKSEVLESALMNMYGKCGTLEDAEIVFHNMYHGSAICWNAMISVYTLQGHSTEALVLFRQMQQLDVMPSKVTFISILNACASLTALEEAQVIYGCIAVRGLESDVLIATALMSIYGKCGALEDARKVFDGIQKRDVIAWNVLISVYGQQGHGKKALQVFQEMVAEKAKPNDVTFLNLLSSCSHAGLLDEGQQCFLSMGKDYGIKPTLEHYGCMIDLYGRAGQLVEAEDFILKWSLQQHALVWTNLLGACRLHGDAERGKRAAETIVHLEGQDSATYVLLANMC